MTIRDRCLGANAGWVIGFLQPAAALLAASLCLRPSVPLSVVHFNSRLLKTVTLQLEHAGREHPRAGRAQQEPRLGASWGVPPPSWGFW